LFRDFRIFANRDVGDLVASDGPEIVRTWEYGEEDFEKTLAGLADADLVHIQYNPPFYSLKALGNLISALKQKGKTVYVTLHSVRVTYADFGRNLGQIDQADRIFVHSHADLEFLEHIGYKHLEYFEHPATLFNHEDRFRLRERLGIGESPVLATHGLIHEKKGLLETISAAALLKEKYPDLLLLCINAVNPNNSTSSSTLAKMKRLVKEKGLEASVLFFTDFLQLAEIEKLLQAADLILLPYPELAESASGAVRTAFAANRPVVITQSSVFSELPAGFRIRDNKPLTIAEAVERLISDQDLYLKEVKKTGEYLQKNSWENQSLNFLQKAGKDLTP
jgi:glycosyltransferase involved in cell wall biosynthesis